MVLFNKDQSHRSYKSYNFEVCNVNEIFKTDVDTLGLVIRRIDFEVKHQKRIENKVVDHLSSLYGR